MSSANQNADLTGRARIRDAALAVFADRGDKGATIRGIAQQAGVSAALVQHHFGTKEKLRAACDDYVLEYLRQGVAEGIDQGGIADPGFTVELYRTGPPVVRYLSRALVDGSPGASVIFDRIVELSAPYLTGASDVDSTARATVLVAMRLGMVVLHAQVSRNIGVDMLSTEGALIVGSAMIDILNPDLTDPQTLVHARQGIDSLRRQGTANAEAEPTHPQENR